MTPPVKYADITLRIPLGPDGTLEDAEVLGDLIARLALGAPDNQELKPVGVVYAITLVDGNRLGHAGAAALLRDLGEGRR